MAMNDATDIANRGGAAEGAAGGDTGETGGTGAQNGAMDDAKEAAPQRTLGDSLSQEAVEKMGRHAVEGEGPGIDLVMRIPVTVQAVLGRARMPIASLMKLGPGSVVPLDHRVGEPVDVVVNGRLVARGEVVLLEEDSERFGISLTEIVEPGSRSC